MQALAGLPLLEDLSLQSLGADRTLGNGLLGFTLSALRGVVTRSSSGSGGGGGRNSSGRISSSSRSSGGRFGACGGSSGDAAVAMEGALGQGPLVAICLRGARAGQH